MKDYKRGIHHLPMLKAGLFIVWALGRTAHCSATLLYPSLLPVRSCAIFLNSGTRIRDCIDVCMGTWCLHRNLQCMGAWRYVWVHGCVYVCMYVCMYECVGKDTCISVFVLTIILTYAADGGIWLCLLGDDIISPGMCHDSFRTQCCSKDN